MHFSSIPPTNDTPDAAQPVKFHEAEMMEEPPFRFIDPQLTLGLISNKNAIVDKDEVHGRVLDSDGESVCEPQASEDEDEDDTESDISTPSMSYGNSPTPSGSTIPSSGSDSKGKGACGRRAATNGQSERAALPAGLTIEFLVRRYNFKRTTHANRMVVCPFKGAHPLADNSCAEEIPGARFHDHVGRHVNKGGNVASCPYSNKNPSCARIPKGSLVRHITEVHFKSTQMVCPCKQDIGRADQARRHLVEFCLYTHNRDEIRKRGLPDYPSIFDPILVQELEMEKERKKEEKEAAAEAKKAAAKKKVSAKPAKSSRKRGADRDDEENETGKGEGSSKRTRL